MEPIRRSPAFTLLELIASVAILAVLVTMSVVFVGGYVTESKRIADKQTLAVLNDALNRYKTQGGNLSALTYGAPNANVLARLKTEVEWAGMRHQFLQSGFTVPGRSLGALGEGKNYIFTRFNNYNGLAEGAVQMPASLGSGVGYISNSGTQSLVFDTIYSTTSNIAFKDASGTITRYSQGSVTLPASAFYTFWSCQSNSTLPSGTIYDLRARSKQLTAVDVSGIPTLTVLEVDSNLLTNLDVSKNTNLTILWCSNNKLTSLDVSGLASLTNFQYANNPLTSFSANNCQGLTGLNCHFTYFSPAKLSYFSAKNCSNLTSITLSSNLLSDTVLNEIYQSLTDRTSTTAGGINVSGNPGTTSDDPSIAAGKNWGVTGS